MSLTPLIYQTYIRATPEQVWEAITDPAWTRRYFHDTAVESTFEPGSPIRYAVLDGSGDAVEGIVESAEPPNRLVMTWRSLYDPATAAEPASRVEWTIESAGENLVRLRLVHRGLARSPLTWHSVNDGWNWVLGALKTVLETGESLPRAVPSDAAAPTPDEITGEWHRSQAIDANNSTWEMFDAERTSERDEEMLRRAYAAAYHWQRAARRTVENEVRARYMLSKAHLAAGDVAGAARHASACLAGCREHGLVGFDLAYAYEVEARAAAASGDEARSRELWAAAKGVPIADPEDKAIVDADFADAPV